MMINWFARILLALVAVGTVVFLFWIGGGEFVRGKDALMAALGAIIAGLASLSFPGFDKESSDGKR